VFVMKAWLGTVNCFSPAASMGWHSAGIVWAEAASAGSVPKASKKDVTSRRIRNLL
jgi:hypothetical protein